MHDIHTTAGKPFKMSTLLRWPVRRLRAPIRSGPNAGLWWSLATRTRFLRGVYESEQAWMTQQCLAAGDVFWDLGAHFGYYTLLASRAVAGGPSPAAGKVYAFEPVPSNRWYLERHVAWNRLDNVEVLPLAVSRTDGHSGFRRYGTGSGRLDQRGELQVATRSVDSLVASGLAAPTCMKIDVEGAEADVLLGARRTLLAHPVLLIVALHGDTARRQCNEILSAFGMAVCYLPERSLIVAHSSEARLPTTLIDTHLSAA